jgi:hypothetical protein
LITYRVTFKSYYNLSTRGEFELLGKALIVFLILSFVSLLADVTYEGARSISGPYLEILGATLIVAGGISFGELVSYVARFAGGLIAFKLASSTAYWVLLILGYLINLAAVPLLALAGSWELAFTLYIVERVGKGFRVPIRDTILAEVSTGVGSGKVFAFHELLDQVGGVAGPLVVAYAIASTGSYRPALLILALPAILAIALLITASTVYPHIRSARRPSVEVSRGLQREFYLFTLAIALAMAGFIHWGQASYILSTLGGVNIALLYALAMLIDGLVAIPLGLALDRWGLKVTAILPLLALTSTLTIFETGNPLAFTIAWGATMGAIEVLPKAAVATMVREEFRSIAYSTLFISMGAGWTLGNLVMAYLSTAEWALLATITTPVAISTIILLKLRGNHL